MAKIEDKNFYIGVTPYEHEGQTYDVLNVTAGYRKGRGFYANIHAGWKTDWGGYGCTFDFSGNPLTDTIWVDVKDSPKNSQKTIDVMAAALQQAKDDIAYLFNERDWEHLKHLMKSVALYGYTASTCEFMKNVKNEAMVKAQVRAARESANEKPSETMGQKTMKQFKDLKAKHPDALLLFRCGDFYEAYCEDAVECAKILGITLTTHKDGYQMAMFPHHALDTYLPKLIRAGKRVAICDELEDPKLTKKLVKRGITEQITTATEESNNKNQTTMAQNNMKAADLIGKVIIVGDNVASITIKSAEDDTLQGEFKKGDAAAIPMPIKLAQLEKMLSDKVWKLQGDTAAETPADEVEEVDDIKVEPAKTTAKTIEMPKAKKSGKPKKQEPKAKADGKLTYSTYTNKKGKTCARILGFGENDPAYVNAADLHGSATYERNKDGGKTFYLIFGPRYADAAKEVCDALNAGKALKDCQSIIDKATEERARTREEWKQKREERKAAKEDEPKGKTYTEAEVADLIKRVVAGDKEAMEIVNAMSKAA